MPGTTATFHRALYWARPVFFMTSPPSKDRVPASDPPTLNSAVRPAERALSGSSEPLEIALEDLERVTLLDLPAIARYGRYELLGRIAYGGMAEIFLAREAGHQGTQRLLVIKRVLPNVAEDRHFVDMFVDEARLAMLLSHPNICHVYSFGEEEGTYYIAMEWVNGKPLSKIIRRARESGGLPIPVALKIIAQVAEALDYAHRACDAAGDPLGIVHRDVSPQNIIVSYDGVVKLLDFGIAKATSHSTRTEAGVIKGKFAYMSPQQCVGEPIDGRADVFALGLCMFEALTGRNPFRRKTEFETMTRIVGEPAPSARERRPDVPEAVEEIVQRALMKQPELRFQSAGDMQFAIESVLPTFGILMNAARVGEYMSRLFADEVRAGPELDLLLRTSIVPSGATSDVSRESERRRAVSTSTELDGEPITRAAEPPKKSPRLLPLAFALVLLIAVGTGSVLAWMLLAPDAPEAVAVVVPPPVPTLVQREEPAIEAAPSLGSVLIDSVPAGASVRFGSQENAGTTPLEIGMLEPGSYDVRLMLEGHEEWTGRVHVLADERAALNAQLVARERRASSPPGELSLNTQPWSRVYLGGRLLGTTPLGRVSVPSGTQRLRLIDRDGNEHRRTVRIPAGGHLAESFDLQ